MPRSTDAARSGLQACNAAEVSRHTNGSATVAAQSSSRAVGSDGGRFSSAGASRGSIVIPRICRPAGDRVIALVIQQKLGAICLAQHHGAGLTQSGNRGRVSLGPMPDAQLASAQSWVGTYVKAVFDCYRNAVQRTGR